MNTIIEKIRAEVNKLPEKNKGLYKQFGNSLGFIDGLDMVKKILSDLEKEEKPMNLETLEEDVKSWFFNEISSKINVEHTMYYYFQECARRYYELGRQSKPKVCEGLEEEIDKLWKEWISEDKEQVEGVLPKSEFAFYARLFAQWGAEHLKK